MSQLLTLGFILICCIVIGLNNDCCQFKENGGDKYHLKRKDEATSQFDCDDNCVYGKHGSSNSEYCFKKGVGNLSECQSDINGDKVYCGEDLKTQIDLYTNHWFIRDGKCCNGTSFTCGNGTSCDVCGVGENDCGKFVSNLDEDHC